MSPQDWNALINDPEVKVVDTRNWYEFELGTFKGAIDPGTKAFRDFETWVRDNLDREGYKGGDVLHRWHPLRKSVVVLLNEGFPSVFHLEGHP